MSETKKGCIYSRISEKVWNTEKILKYCRGKLFQMDGAKN